MLHLQVLVPSRSVIHLNGARYAGISETPEFRTGRFPVVEMPESQQSVTRMRDYKMLTHIIDDWFVKK